MTVQIGRKWDLTSCGAISATTSSFNITSWPRGDHNNALDYSASGECTEDPSTCRAEVVAVVVSGVADGTISFAYYDPYGRNIFNYSVSGTYATAWVGRFGESNLYLEIYKPGKYYCNVSYVGGSTTVYFDVYDQTTNKYLHKQGSDNAMGNSWGAALATWGSAQTALTSGKTLYVGEGDYSTETGFSFTKSMTITPTKATWGGFPNNTSTTYVLTAGDHGAELIADMGNPIEMDGIIDRWAYYSGGNSSNTVTLKIYRGGHAGTVNNTTSTLIYTSDTHTETTAGWKTYTITPQSVQRGDIVAVQSSEVYANVGLYDIVYPPTGSYLATGAVVVGNPGNTAMGGTAYQGLAAMVRAWNSGTTITTTLPKTS